MVDTTQELVDGMREMRVRQAILVTALLKLGAPLVVSHDDAYASARFDVEVKQTPLGLHVVLLPALADGVRMLPAEASASSASASTGP